MATSLFLQWKVTNYSISVLKVAVLKGSLLFILLHLNHCATNQTLVQLAEVLCIQLKPCAYSSEYHTQCTRAFSTSHQDTPQGLPSVPLCNQSNPCALS